MSAQPRQPGHRVPRTVIRRIAPLALVLGFAWLSLAGGMAPAAADQETWYSGQNWGGQNWGGQGWGQSQHTWSHKSWSKKQWSHGGWSQKKWSKWRWKDSARHHRHKFHHGFPPRVVLGGNGVLFSKPGFFVPPRFIVRQPRFIVRQPGFIVRQPGFAADPPGVVQGHPSLQQRPVPVMRSPGARLVTPGMMSPSIRIIRPGN